jgi:Family of unknown function (DUF5686)/CarboxypepD_reg-like domain
MLKGILLSLLFVSPTLNLFATGIRGIVYGNEGDPLAFATIFVKQTGTGTVTNENGRYELILSPGHYEFVYQYLGFETQVKQVVIGDEFVELNITLKQQVTILQTVTVRAGKEDPAYTIMRKAIAKANYHQNELNSYSAQVYIKGAGRLKDYPWLAKRALEKEGVQKNRVYVSESVSEIKYTRPNKFDERVISIHSDGKDNNTSPNPFIFGSFYEPEIAGTISPLSPKAFSYYRFEYQGTFRDRDYEVSRIKVIPRSRGDNVVEGMLYILEDWWSIHSLDLKTTKLGIDILVNSVYAPIDDKVWLPVSFRFTVDGKVFGFDFEYKYLASLSNYNIELNPDVYVENQKMEVIDEIIEKEHAREIEQKHGDEKEPLLERLQSEKEITRKELKKLMKEYDKQETKSLEEPEVISNVTFKIDSGAYKKDSVYWKAIRPIPLTKGEVQGYQKYDSLAKIDEKKEAGDTLKGSRHVGFQPWDLIIGDSYSLGKQTHLRIYTPGGGFNTVEGFYLHYKVSYGRIFEDTARTRLTVTPVLRYAFSPKRFNGHLLIDLRNRNCQFKIDGGRYVSQYNSDNPIWYLVNTFTTLFLEKNLMKLYERDYVDLYFRRRLSPFVTTYVEWSWMKRRELFNTTDYKWFTNKNVEGYTPNRPENLELENTGFPEHNAVVGTLGIVARPWLKYRIRNGRRHEIHDSSPTFTLEYRKGLDKWLGSEVSFDQIELGIKQGIKVGVRGRLDLSVRGGKFLNTDKMYFMDYKHFSGNLTPFTTSDPVGSFRLLDYYLYSTADKYISGNIHYQFRKFLATQFPLVRLTGVRENIFLNYLATPSIQNYTEVGYSIDGILRLLRLEVAASFHGGQYLKHGFRIGIATNIRANFDDQ